MLNSVLLVIHEAEAMEILADSHSCGSPRHHEFSVESGEMMEAQTHSESFPQNRTIFFFSSP
jgi:hypothetical protein